MIQNPLLQIACAAAREAGEEILKLYASTEFETKLDGSPLTVADSRSNEILLKHLTETDILILSEESNGVPLPYPKRMWIIDPLDGTKDFLKKTNDFAVMIGLIENGRPILGVVYAPVFDTLYYAEQGQGAFMEKDGETVRLSVSEQDSEKLRMLCSVNHFTPDMESIAQTLNAEKQPRGSLGVKAGVLSEGKADFFFSQGKFGEWDVCGPEIITIEAGGTVTDCTGAPLFYGTHDHRIAHGIIFSNTTCHDRVFRAISATTETGTP